MKNTEIFEDFDMVVSVTQKTINDQLTHLLRMGTIHPEFIVYQDIDDDGNYIYQVVDSTDQIPKDAHGKPTVAYLNGAIWPQIYISASGTEVTFVLNFRSGTAYFWTGSGPAAKLKASDMTGWKYGISVTLDLAAIEKADLANNTAVPQLVQDQLHNFMDNMFTVKSLFMDFESTDLLRFDPAHTDASGVGDVGTQQFVEFMQGYLTKLTKNGNPYVLGYAVTTTDATTVPPDQNVPDALKPVGTTFTVYADPVTADLSSVNFVLSTKGGHGGIAHSAGTFDTNWISPSEQCDAKLIYSHACLLEYLFVKPFFTQLYGQVYDRIKDNINVPQGNDYDHARQVTSTGLKFDISEIAQGDDQYVNYFTVDFVNGDQQVTLNYSGHLSTYKGVNREMGFCTATAHASALIEWSASVTITSAKDEKGEPTLVVNKTPLKIDKFQPDSDRNTCAEAFDWIGKILGGILDAFTFFADGGYFMNLFDKIFDLPTPEIPNVGVALDNLANTVSSLIILPAGQVFFFKNPASDLEGNFNLELTYKSDN